jgi:hypothetical protein
MAEPITYANTAGGETMVSAATPLPVTSTAAGTGSINQTQINGQAVSTAANGLQNVAVTGLALSTADFGATTVIFPTNSANPASSFGPLATSLFLAGASAQDPLQEASALPTGGVGVAAVEFAGNAFSNIKTAATTTVKSGAGTLHRITVNTLIASATISIFDNTAGSGTTIGKLTLPSTITGVNPFTVEFDLHFATGLTIITSGLTDITVTYR